MSFLPIQFFSCHCLYSMLHQCPWQLKLMVGEREGERLQMDVNILVFSGLDTASWHHRDQRIYALLQRGEEGHGDLKMAKYFLETKDNPLKFPPSIQSCFLQTGFLQAPRELPPVYPGLPTGHRAPATTGFFTSFCQALKALCRVPRTRILHIGKVTSINITRSTRRTSGVTCAFVPTWQPGLVFPYEQPLSG